MIRWRLGDSKAAVITFQVEPGKTTCALGPDPRRLFPEVGTVQLLGT